MVTVTNVSKYILSQDILCNYTTQTDVTTPLGCTISNATQYNLLPMNVCLR